MAYLSVRTVPDPVLRQKAKKIPGIDSSIRRLIEDMIETMYEADGVGLAAPQVGVSLRLVVICMPEEDAGEIVLINPEIVKKSGEREVDERCLSIPGYYGQLKRAVSVTVKARDENWKEIRIKGEGLLAQALEHEIDHLNGVLYVDHLDGPDKLFRNEVAASKV
ncbi:MAG: peptide deformylase [Dehalococcoidales bacterium]|nr:peptide deformylase [Dehalococcoidales bacterium]